MPSEKPTMYPKQKRNASMPQCQTESLGLDDTPDCEKRSTPTTNNLTKIRKFCAYQDRSVAEVRTKLKGYLLWEEDIENVINELIEEEFLNDERFAANFVKSKLRAKGWGAAKIKFHLKQKGISNEIITNVLNEVEATEWNEQLQQNIEKWKRSHELSHTTYPKLVRFLSGKGFNISDIMKNIRLLCIIIMVFLVQSCGTHYKIPSLKPNAYYSTQIDQKPYIIYIDTLINIQKKTQSSILKPHTTHLHATAYLIDTSEFTSPKSLQIDYKRRKTKVFLDNHKTTCSHVFEEYVQPVITTFPNRFRDSLFAVQVFKDVVYSQVRGFWDTHKVDEEEIAQVLLSGMLSSVFKKQLDLKMDIYVPKQAGNFECPLLMLLHGGAFYVGDKSEETLVKICRHFASMGYTTVSIDYRLGFQPTKNSLERAGYMALQDAHAAMRFLIANADKYKIDTEYLFVGGSSAGAITALGLAFMQNQNRPASSYKHLLNQDLGDIESSGEYNDITFQVKSVANFWGAVYNLEILKNSNTSVLSYHGTKDPIVPYDYDYPMQKMLKKMAPVLSSKIYGSKPIHEELKKLGYREKLVPIDAEAHKLWEANGQFSNIYPQIINDMSAFFYVDLVPKPATLTHDPTHVQRYHVANNKEILEITWQCNGGFIINNNNNNEISVIWRTNATDRKLLTSGIYKNGIPFQLEIKK